MSLYLADKWLWDPWFAQDGENWHLFYLQAPRQLGAPDERHWHVSIGHAFSTDLHNWQVLPDALRPSDGEDDWDNYTTWTGSILQRGDRWYLFYTGSRRSEAGKVQRIGMASSVDLMSWQKFKDNPVLTGKDAPYEQLATGGWREQAWRDPWVFEDPETGDVHAFVTARIARGAVDGRGVIAHARSIDLRTWQVLPPVTGSGDFNHMELPQHVGFQGNYYLLFGVERKALSSRRRADPTAATVTGIYYLRADSPFGPYSMSTCKLLLGDSSGTYYAGKLLEPRPGELVYMPALFNDSQGDFLGAIGDPMPVVCTESGDLAVVAGPGGNREPYSP
ncbi:MAG: hypothetical protein WBR18_11410 [Anaerolineales bacterium]